MTKVEMNDVKIGVVRPVLVSHSVLFLYGLLRHDRCFALNLVEPTLDIRL